ncbi:MULTISPECIES: hypothetical protein [Candidatus Cardinium]|uniref:hypothetical protein n=1 Tax=Candidatus Cardinium TaxID=273135 RepID=UPI001FA9FCF3|nr:MULTISPECIES: hypothetical protein [Cardinium]
MKKYIVWLPLMASCNGLGKSAMDGSGSVASNNSHNNPDSKFSCHTLEEVATDRIRSLYDSIIASSQHPGVVALDLFKYINQDK